MSAIDELKNVAKVVKSKKGRMDAREREVASELIVSVWKDASLDPSESFSALEPLQSEAIAEGIAQVWGNLTDDRRKLFDNWLSKPKNERSSRRLALLSASLLQIDGITSLNWLNRLLPANSKGKITRELGQILVSVFFGTKPLRITRLAEERRGTEDLGRVVRTLLEVAVDDHWAVELMVRYRLVEDILTIAAERSPETAEWKAIQNRIEIEIKRWPQPLVRQLNRALCIRFPEAQPVFTKIMGRCEAPPPTPTPTRQPGEVSDELRPLVENLVEDKALKTLFDRRLAAISAEIEELKALVIVVAERETALKDAERRLEESQVRESSLQAAMKRLEGDLEDSIAKTKQANLQIVEIERANRMTKENLEADRDRLRQQITANAVGRVEEFKNNLAIVLARLIRDLPNREERLTPEVGNIVFLQFHQFLDALDAQGIKVRRSRGAV
jgi:hypothetical protein